MNSTIFNFCSQIPLSSVFPTVAIFKKYNTFIQLKNVSSAKYEIENTVCHDDLTKYLTKYANIYIHVNKCNSAMNGNLYNLSDIIRAIDSKGEDMRIDANYKLNDLKVEITEQQTKIFKMTKQMISLRPTVQEFEEENQSLSLLERQADDLRELISTGEELEHLSDNIAENISEKIYECLKEDDDVSEGLIMLPGALQNKQLDSLLDEIFDDGLGIRCEDLDFDDILEFTVSNDKATDLFLRVRIQELETLTSNNNNEDDSVFDEEEEENSEWETQSIDEKENPSVKTDLIGPIPKDWQPEEEEEPHDEDECKHCRDYHILIQELNEKNKKIQNQKEIIDNQDKQIEEYDEIDSDVSEWKFKYLGLSECFDETINEKQCRIEEMQDEIDERDETIKKLREELTRQREKNKNNNI
jgi:hypothetical protein